MKCDFFQEIMPIWLLTFYLKIVINYTFFLKTKTNTLVDYFKMNKNDVFFIT